MFGKKNLQIEKDRAWSKHGFYLCIPFDKYLTQLMFICIIMYILYS